MKTTNRIILLMATMLALTVAIFPSTTEEVVMPERADCRNSNGNNRFYLHR